MSTAIVAAALVLVPNVARAQHAIASSPAFTTPPARPLLLAPSRELDAVEADIRAAWIQSRLDAESAAAQRWYWLVIGLTGAVTVAQFAVGLAVTDTGPDGRPLPLPDQLRPAMYVGGVTAALGLVALAVFPFHPMYAAGELRHVRARTPEERIARARRAEAILDDCAEQEDFGRSFWLHAFGVVLGAGSSLILWLGYHQNALTVIGNFVGTVALNELQVFTQPTQLIDDRATYRRDRWRSLAVGRPRSATGLRVQPTAFPGGAGIVVTF